MKIAFCDSSAIVKLVVVETESAALRLALQQYARRNTSDVSLVEVPRAVSRRDPKLESQSHRILNKFETLAMSEHIAARAALLNPKELRSLDAIQLAAALSISTVEIDFIAYDERLLQAAAQAGLRTLSPS